MLIIISITVNITYACVIVSIRIPIKRFFTDLTSEKTNMQNQQLQVMEIPND